MERARFSNVYRELFVIEYNRDASLYGTVSVKVLNKLYIPLETSTNATAFFTETLANGQVNQALTAHGVRQILIPPPL